MAQVHIQIPHENQAFRRELENIVSSASSEQLYYALNSEHSPLHSSFLHFLAFSYAEWLVQQPDVDMEKTQREWKAALSPKNGTYHSNNDRPMNGFVSVGLDDVKTPDSDDSSDLGDVIVTHPLGNANDIDDEDDLSTSPARLTNHRHHHNEDFDHEKYIMTAKGLRIRMKEKDPWQHVMPIYDQFYPMRKRGSGIDLSDTQAATGEENGNMDAFSKLPKEKMNVIKSKLPLLADTRSADQREELMCRKLELCRVVFDFNSTSVAEIKAIEKKKTILTEILEYVARFNWYSEKVLRQCFVTIAANLFRALSSPARSADETEPFEDRAWSHLQLVYDLTLRLVICTDVDKKIMRKYLEGDFVANIIELFASDDHREREYLKTILHRIYGRFMPLRGVIRQSISNCCFRTVYSESRSANGIAEFLEIFCSIIHGFSIPVKEEHKEFLRNVLVPLHKCRKLEKFHEQLVACCVQFVFKDPSVAPVILGGLLRFWPMQSPIKEEMFITELINIISALLNHKNGFEWNDYKGILMQVIDKIVECMTCGHHQVAERAVALWMEESMEQLCDQDRPVIWMRLAAAFEKNKDHWNVNLRQTNDEVLEHVRNRDPEEFSKFEQKVLDRYQSSSTEGYDDIVDPIIESVQEKKLRKQASRAPRELQWAQLLEAKLKLEEEKRMQEEVKKEIYSPRRASQAELVELISESMRVSTVDDDDKDFEDMEDDIDQKDGNSFPKMNGYHENSNNSNSNGSLSVPQSLAVRTDDLHHSGSSGDESGSEKGSPKKRRAISPASVKRKTSPSRPTRRDGDGAAPRDDESDHPRRKSPLRDASSGDAPDSPTRRTGRSRVSKSNQQRSIAKSPGRARQRKGGQRSTSDRPSSSSNSGTKSRQSRPAKSRSARSLRMKSGSSSSGGYVE